MEKQSEPQKFFIFFLIIQQLTVLGRADTALQNSYVLWQTISLFDTAV